MENKANTALLAEIASTNALNELELFDILNIQLTPATFSRSPQVDMDPAFEAAANKFYSGSMSWHDYLLFSINFFSEQTQENHDQDTLAEQTVNNELQNGTRWSFVKDVFVFVQVLLIILSIFLIG